MGASVGSGARRARSAWLPVLACAALLVGLTFQEPVDDAPEAPDPEAPAQMEEISPPTEEPAGVTPLPSPDLPPTATPPSVTDTPDSTDRPTATPTPGTPTAIPPVITTPATRTPTSVVRGEPPAPPARLNIRAIAIGTVGLEWVDSSDNEQGYRIDVSGPTPRSHTLPPNATEYNFGGLRTGTYCFDVVAFNQHGDSPAVQACIGVR